MPMVIRSYDQLMQYLEEFCPDKNARQRIEMAIQNADIGFYPRMYTIQFPEGNKEGVIIVFNQIREIKLKNTIQIIG